MPTINAISIFRYACAFLSVSLAVGVRVLLEPLLGPAYPFATVFLAVLVTAWYGGYRPAILAIILGAIASNYYLIPPYGEFGTTTLVEQVGMLLFIITSMGIALLGGTMHRAQGAFQAANAQLETRVQERTVELEQSRSSLAKSEQSLRQLVEGASNHAIFLLDSGGTVVTWNPGAERIYGFMAEDIVGQHFSRLFPAESIAMGLPQRALDRAHFAGRYTEEAVRCRRDGTPFWARMTMTSVIGEDGGDAGFVKITEDLSERKRAEDAQREAEERLLSALRWSHTGGWDLNLTDRTAHRTLEHDQIFGYAEGLPEWTYERFLEHVLPEDQDEVNGTFEAAIAARTDWGFECRIRRTDGEVRWIWAAGGQQFDSEGNALRMSGIVQDITDRKRAEIELQDRERFLRFVTSSVRVGLVVIGPDYRYLFANESYAKIYGLDTEVIVGRRVDEVFPMAWSQIKPHLDRSLGGNAGSYELSLPPLPGSERSRTFLVVYEPRTTDAGLPTSVVVVTDITERKQADEAATRMNERIALATRAARLGIWDWDLIEDRIEWDDHMFVLYKRDKTNFRGAYDVWLASIHPDDLDRCNRETMEARSGHWDYDSEFRILWPDGSVRHIKAMGEVFRDESGTPVRMLGVNFDITEQKRADAALLETQAILEVALASMTDAVFISDANGHFIHFNDAFAKFLRFNDKSQCARQLEEYPDIIDVYWDNGELAPLEDWAIPRALRGEICANAEYTIRRKDTGESWYGSYSFSPIRDGEGAIVGAVAVGRDITDRKQAEVEAREREERFRQLAENIREVFWLNDPVNFQVLYVSPAYETIWERSLESLYRSPRDWMEAIHPEDRARVNVAFLEQQKGLPYDEEYRVVRPDGSIRWIHDKGFPVRNDAGEVYRIAGVAEDITERRQAEIASQLHKMRLEGIVNSAMDGIITLEEDQSVVFINSAAERIFGCWSDDVIGTHVSQFIPERFRVMHEAFIREFDETGVAARAMGNFGPVCGVRANGEEFPIEASISQIDVEGHKLFTVTCRDITERIEAVAAQKKLELQLQQSQKMEAFGQLAGGVSHDFNNLLTVISGYSEWLLADLPADNAIRGMIEEIHKAGTRATSLTRQLLAFSRQQVLEPRVLDINDIVRDTEKMLRRLIGEDIQMVAALNLGIDSVKVDPGQIEQVIMNFVVNSRDAMPRGGKITIETGVVAFDESYTGTHSEVQPGRYVMLAVSDTGAGISQELKSRIFEPFFTTKEVGKGTGLGLAVAHGIIKQSGGSIEVYSELGKGTTFKIYLPVVQSAQPVEAEHAAPETPRGTEIILLVEDESGVRDFAALALQGIGYNVLIASSGQAALDILATYTGKVDLLLTDVVMPGLSGRQLAESLVERYPGLKVLFMSGYTDDAIVRHGILQAEVSFLHKPFSMDSLARKVREVLDER